MTRNIDVKLNLVSKYNPKYLHSFKETITYKDQHVNERVVEKPFPQSSLVAHGHSTRRVNERVVEKPFPQSS